MSLTLTKLALPVLVLAAATLALPAAFRASLSTQDPLTAARFSLLADGREIAAFTELQEISSSVDLVEGSGSGDVLILRRPLTSRLELAAWQEEVLQEGAGARKSCSLVMYDAEGTPVARYRLENAWPSKIEIQTLKAGSSSGLVEKVTVSSERAHREL